VGNAVVRGWTVNGTALWVVTYVNVDVRRNSPDVWTVEFVRVVQRSCGYVDNFISFSFDYCMLMSVVILIENKELTVMIHIVAS